MQTSIRPRTVKLFAKLLHPLTEEGVVLVSEEKEITAQLNHLARKGQLIPAVVQHFCRFTLIDQLCDVRDE